MNLCNGNIFKICSLIILLFICGSIPFSYITVKLYKNVDIRNFGTHNPGAGNVIKVFGWKIGILALIGDLGKGTLSMYAAHLLCKLDPYSLLFFVIFPILGHVFSPFLKFKGGKGAAVTGGMFLYIVWLKSGYFKTILILVLVLLFTALIYYLTESLVLGLSGIPLIFPLLLYNFGFSKSFIILTTLELLVVEIIAIPFLKRDIKKIKDRLIQKKYIKIKNDK